MHLICIKYNQISWNPNLDFPWILCGCKPKQNAPFAVLGNHKIRRSTSSQGQSLKLGEMFTFPKFPRKFMAPQCILAVFRSFIARYHLVHAPLLHIMHDLHANLFACFDFYDLHFVQLHTYKGICAPPEHFERIFALLHFPTWCVLLLTFAIELIFLPFQSMKF